MRVLEVRLENDDYDRFAAAAAKAGTPPETAAAEAVMAWTRLREKEGTIDEEALRQRFIRLRLKDRDRTLGAIAQEMGVDVAVTERWNRQIRSGAADWSRAFVFASKSVDPLTWEMTVRDRFYDLWGHRPQT
jgi:hypothetical protein